VRVVRKRQRGDRLPNGSGAAVRRSTSITCATPRFATNHSTIGSTAAASRPAGRPEFCSFRIRRRPVVESPETRSSFCTQQTRPSPDQTAFRFMICDGGA
jgi:hypothetical protein